MSVALHIVVAGLLFSELPLFDRAEPVTQMPVIPLEFEEVGETTNVKTAGKPEEVETPPQATAPEAPPAPPPPPPSKAEPAPPPAPAAPPEKEKEVAEPEPAPAPPPMPSPRPTIERQADKRLAERETAQAKSDKLAALEKLPVPKPKPTAKPAPEVTPKSEEKPTPPKPDPEPKTTEREEEPRFDASQLAAKIDRLSQDRPEPREEERRDLSDIKIGEGGQSQNRLNARLTVSEIDRLRVHLASNWTPNHGAPGIEQMQVVVRIYLNRDGSLSRRPEVISGYDAGQSDDVYQAFAESALRAVHKSQPLPLPSDKFDVWHEIEITFSLKDMYG